jgi:hypothetical protein
MRRLLFLTILLGVSACGDSPPKVNIGEALPTLLIPPQSTVVSREGGAEALKIRFRSALPPDQVATYYRTTLSRAPWNLVSDTPDAEGGIALYAERPNGPPLWVSIRKSTGGPGSFVDLAGAKTK